MKPNVFERLLYDVYDYNEAWFSLFQDRVSAGGLLVNVMSK